MAEKIRVLNINYNSSEFGGVPVFLMNIFPYIDHERFLLDFLTPDTTSYNPWKEEIERTGGHLYDFHINSRTARGQIQFGRRLRGFLKDHPYDIVHIGSGSLSFDCISAYVAKSKDTKVIIHSHNSNIRNWWKKLFSGFLKVCMQHNADILCACSEAAARYIFTKRKVNQGNVIIVKNGIDLQKFCFNLEKRNKIRSELNLKDQLIVGNVGRFAEQKNHDFLINVFAEILKEKPTAILLLIGEGELESCIREKICSLNIEDNVIFMGTRKDVDELYQAMDIFLFPSLYEGLGIVLIEAQTSGLPCYISDVIPNEVDVTDLMHRISLQVSAEKWAEIIINDCSKHIKRISHDEELYNSGYGIEAVAFQIMQIYNRLV